MQGHGRCLKLFLAFALLLLQNVKGGEVGRSDKDANATGTCVERERQALLAFKRGLVDEYNSLSSWSSESHKQDCCRWIGVSCNNHTGHVIQLDLEDYLSKGKMISPKLIELQHLQHLDLGEIDFNGSQVPDSVGSLTNLRYLDLSSCNFGGQIPSQIGNLTQLQYLHLGGNQFNVENLNWLTGLSSLTDLDISDVNLSNIFDWPEAVNKLPKLRHLDLRDCSLPPPPPRIHSTPFSNINSSTSLTDLNLRDNHLTSTIFLWLSNYTTASLVDLNLSKNNLTGLIPDVIGNMSSLASLDLSDNQIEGGNPNSFARLCSLQFLDIPGNRLSGQLSKFVQLLPTCTQNSLETLDLSHNDLAGSLTNLTTFSSLQILSVNNNQLTGRIPESIGQMSQLEHIDFGMNSLEGVVSETHFSHLHNLSSLDLSSNSLVLNFPSDWVPPFQLDTILLSSCKMGPHFPKWLQTQNDCLALDISDAEISDILPSWFWSMFCNSVFINLSNNQIRGIFANLTVNFAIFPEVYLSSNQIQGPIPSTLLQASYLDLSNNNISGSLSLLCASATSLTFLNLSSNSVSGELPDCWNKLENLVMLDLSNNAFSGKIPTTIGSLFKIETLKLRNNSFAGELPSSLKNCTSLEVIDLGNNKLSGPIPTWLGVSFKNLVILMLSFNNFNGSMPPQLCHLVHVQILDFSMNNISGSIPKCLNNLTALSQKGNSSLTSTHYYRKENDKIVFPGNSYEDDATFIWKGRMSTYKSILGLVKRIDLSSNRLTGEIPSEITYLVELVSLNLSRNQLTGQITPEIGNLQSLDSLDLSRNRISGRIPTSLARIDRLAVLDLSYNNLSGQIPIGTQLQSFDRSVYAENPQLCGAPLLKMCADPSEYSNTKDTYELITLGFYISMALGFVAGFWGVCFTLIFKRSWRYEYFKFLNGLNDWLYVRVALIKRQLKDTLN
ncbi:hypothetical protein PRUPE_2G167600 [Prunus persica]|uniref:Uncharacterized protein n=2 Tax=Prunus persica TaxID=3760 RepID=A0A251QH05_PRUPE|nr:probable LRR receptor-like serine/threonine-protein kinase At4g36180 [Prunus persica]XP_020414164.1 probable LRR receptor-like serine/threonine-protein kinase At4g36180 [Prunus persica]ONI23057.1 hypothetical protein PRUPE_2G167600 [Prunus persica]ONI23058.1 hypothetical protein PRUPE_2G167600 [Prunus persica]